MSPKPWFEVGDHVVVTKPGTAWTGMKGRIISATLTRLKDSYPTRFMICMDQATRYLYMTTETETKPEIIEDTKPKLHDGSGNDDERLRHIAERKRPDSQSFKKVALCGAKVKDIHVEHNGEICQECVDEMKRREG